MTAQPMITNVVIHKRFDLIHNTSLGWGCYPMPRNIKEANEMIAKHGSPVLKVSFNFHPDYHVPVDKQIKSKRRKMDKILDRLGYEQVGESTEGYTVTYIFERFN